MVPNGAGETLVTLGVVVLQADLQLDGLVEAALGLGIVRRSEDAGNCLAHVDSRDLATERLDGWLRGGQNGNLIVRRLGRTPCKLIFE